MRVTSSRMLFMAVCAWLSVCLLTAGWSQEWHDQLRPVWLLSGLWGLAATLGVSQRIKLDIRAQEQLIREYRHAAMTDGLTGLANRPALEHVLRNALENFDAKRNPLCLIMIDIDNFKSINDQFGHLAGDEVIKAVSMCAVDFFADRGCVARYGGEEFAVAMPGLSLKDCAKAADGFRTAISDLRYEAAELQCSVTISAGVAEARNGERLDELVRRADARLYSAKRQGKNNVCFTDDCKEKAEFAEIDAESMVVELTLS